MATDSDLQSSSEGMRKNPNMSATSSTGAYDASDSFTISNRDAEDVNDDTIDTL